MSKPLGLTDVWFDPLVELLQHKVKNGIRTHSTSQLPVYGAVLLQTYQGVLIMWLISVSSMDLRYW